MITLYPAAGQHDDLDVLTDDEAAIPATPAQPAPSAPRRASVGRDVARGASAVLATVALGLVVHLAVVSGFEHESSQSRALAKFRGTLAQGTAPVTAVDRKLNLLPLGTPIALLEIRSIGLNEVVGEGTSPSVLGAGPGHRRDTPFPGQRGAVQIYGRRAAYGGPFKRLNRLRIGDEIKVTTGQGVSKYKVSGARLAGDKVMSTNAAGRLTLATASGSAFVPSGVLWIDADLVGSAKPTPARPIPAGAVPSAEKPMGNDATTLWALVLWLQVMVVVAAGAVWSWARWGHHQTWIVFAPIASVVSLEVAGQVTRLLPNLL